MRIWTIQPVEVYEKLLREKELSVQDSLSVYLANSDREHEHGSNWTFRDSYDWLVSMMDKFGIVGHTDEVKYPWWGWYKHGGKYKKPDLRCIGLGNPGEESYCIELDIPDNEVLISDYDMWHCVLNNGDIWKGYETDGDFDKQFDLHEEYTRKLRIEGKYEEYKLKTWERIVGTINKPDDFPDGEYKQVTFWKLRLENVVRAQKFKCR